MIAIYQLEWAKQTKAINCKNCNRGYRLYTPEKRVTYELLIHCWIYEKTKSSIILINPSSRKAAAAAAGLWQQADPAVLMNGGGSGGGSSSCLLHTCRPGPACLLREGTQSTESWDFWPGEQPRYLSFILSSWSKYAWPLAINSWSPHLEREGHVIL